MANKHTKRCSHHSLLRFEKSLGRVRLCATPWTIAHQAPPSMGFSRQEYWSGVPLPSLSTVTGYKINIQKFAAFLYTNNEILETGNF